MKGFGLYLLCWCCLGVCGPCAPPGGRVWRRPAHSCRGWRRGGGGGGTAAHPYPAGSPVLHTKREGKHKYIVRIKGITNKLVIYVLYVQNRENKTKQYRTEHLKKKQSTEQSIWKNRVQYRASEKNRVQYRASEEKTVQFRAFEENNTVDCRVQSICLKYICTV